MAIPAVSSMLRWSVNLTFQSRLRSESGVRAPDELLVRLRQVYRRCASDTQRDEDVRVKGEDVVQHDSGVIHSPIPLIGKPDCSSWQLLLYFLAHSTASIISSPSRPLPDT